MLKRLFLMHLPLILASIFLVYFSARIIKSYIGMPIFSNFVDYIIVVLASLVVSQFLIWPLVFAMMKIFKIKNHKGTIHTGYSGFVNSSTGYTSLKPTYISWSTRGLMCTNSISGGYFIVVLIFAIYYSWQEYRSYGEVGVVNSLDNIVSAAGWPYDLSSAVNSSTSIRTPNCLLDPKTGAALECD